MGPLYDVCAIFPREDDAPQVLRERITFMKTIIRLDVDQNL